MTKLSMVKKIIGCGEERTQKSDYSSTLTDLKGKLGQRNRTEYPQLAQNECKTCRLARSSCVIGGEGLRK